MGKLQNDETGFSVVEVLLVLVIVALICTVGWLVYKNYHKTPATQVTTTSTSTKSTTPTPAKTTTTTVTNPYAGWKTYCDNVYNYCFKYPTNWQLSSAANTATQPCDSGGTSLTSADGEVTIEYQNDNPKDGGLFPFTAYVINSLNLTTQQLSVVGGYSGWGGIYPGYYLIDTSTLSKYPLTIGQTNQQFPQGIEFTDINTGGLTCTGSLSAIPTNMTFSSASSAESWLNTPDAHTGKLILESFYSQ